MTIAELIPAISAQASLIENWLASGTDPFSTEFDTQLGVLEGLIYTTRQEISDEWSARREAVFRTRPSRPIPTTLDDLA